MRSGSVKGFLTIAALLSLAIAVTIHFPYILDFFANNSDEGRSFHRYTPDLSHLFGHLILTWIIAFMMFILNLFILKPLEKNSHVKPLSVILAICLTLASVYILNKVSFSIMNLFEGEIRSGRRRNFYDYANFFVSALVVGSVIIIRLINQKQNVLLEMEALKREALQSQYESLKNQLSPHFLFNSLTALKVLIREAPEKAQDYVNSLSAALRYTLQSNEKMVVTLKEELEFMSSYHFLIRKRFDSNLVIETEIDDSMTSFMLPPLTIQTLIENAIKHNEISKRKPLTVRIMTTKNDSLIVANDIQSKLTDEEGTGIGLTNLSRQLRMLADRDISVSRDHNRFVVEIPLIKP